MIKGKDWQKVVIPSLIVKSDIMPYVGYKFLLMFPKRFETLSSARVADVTDLLTMGNYKQRHHILMMFYYLCVRRSSIANNLPR